VVTNFFDGFFFFFNFPFIIRNGGHLLEIPSSDIVVGDYVLLQSGDRVPADGRIIAGELLVNFHRLWIDTNFV